MKSDVIAVSSRHDQIEEALKQAEKTAAFKGLSRKGTLHLVLLTEEMMGLMRSITGDVTGKFWIEDEDGVFQLHLQVTTPMNSMKRERLLSSSSSGKNESAKGLMGRLRDVFDRSADEDVSAFTSPMLLPGAYEYSEKAGLNWEWSMTHYQQELASLVAMRDEAARKAWDELEKSVVSHVADEVKVSIRGRSAEMIIIKKIA
ncbi:MAG: hypothetical protein J6U63_01860 [Clostridia bacterium]|nr:hypothetical protein [Clostridia bacterium]